MFAMWRLLFFVVLAAAHIDLNLITPPTEQELIDNVHLGLKTPIGDHHHRAFVGPSWDYTDMTGLEFSLLYLAGLKEHHKLLDIGCGSLRLGKVAIPYLLPNHYFGIEPNTWLVEDGIRFETGVDLIRMKNPKFINVTDFSPASFGPQMFEFVIAQSIFSHTGAGLLSYALKNIKPHLHHESVFLFTVLVQGLNPDGVRTTLTDLEWYYPRCTMFDVPQLEEIFGAHSLSVFQLKWPHLRQTWFVTSPSHEKAQMIANKIPYVPHPGGQTNLKARSG